MLFFQVGQLIDPRIDRFASAMNRMDLADGAVPDPLAKVADAIEGVTLIAQLGDDVLLFSRLHQSTNLVHRVGQRFFAVEMLPVFQNGHRRHGVKMIGRGDHDSVDLLVHFIQHLAKVLKLLGVRKLLEGSRSLARVGISQGHDIGKASDAVDIIGAPATDANASKVDLLARGGGSAGRKHMARHNRECGHRSAAQAQEVAACERRSCRFHREYSERMTHLATRSRHLAGWILQA